MSIFIGSNELKEAFVGSAPVKEVYVGANRVWTLVPDINFAPDQWTVGAAGAVWSFGQLETPPAPSFNGSYAEITHKLVLSGSFIAELSWMEATVNVPVAGNYRVRATISAMVSSLNTSSDRVELFFNPASSGSSTVNAYAPGDLVSGSLSVAAGANVTIRLSNNFTAAGNSAGQGGYARITSVILEKV